MRSMEFDKIVEDIGIRTEIIKSFEESGVITFMSSKTSRSVKFTKSDLGEDVFNAILNCMKAVRAKQLEVQNRLLMDEDASDLMTTAEKALSQTRHNSFPVDPRGVDSVGITLKER